MTQGVVHLKHGKERKIRNFYPWVQRGECRAEGVEDGAVCDLVDSDGRFLARGTYNSKSRFQVRVLTLEDRPVDGAFFAERFRAAADLRSRLVRGTDGFRLLYSEADGVPGLIIDQYRSTLVVQVRSLGMERLRDVWIPALIETIGPECVIEKSEMAGREEEGLQPRSGLLHGSLPDKLAIEEDGLTFLVPVEGGLKTGYYLDQRETRRRFAGRIQPKDKVLDCFCYTGAFSLHAARAGANVYGVDIQDTAIDTARENAKINGLEAVFIKANTFDYLLEDAMGPYDWIVLDPPAIAKTAEKRDSLKWAVWKLVHSALPILKPGGRMIVCSCSYQLGLQELIETARLAGSDRNVPLFLEDITFQDLDHPAPIHFPEALYLKCAWLRRG